MECTELFKDHRDGIKFDFSKKLNGRKNHKFPHYEKATFNPVWSLFVSWVIGRGILPSTVSSVGVGEVLVTISLGVTITTFPVIEWLTNFKSVGFCLLSSFPELLQCQLVSDQMIHISKII